MAKRSLLWMPAAILSVAIASPILVVGSDPVVRQYIRNIDEDPKTGAPATEGSKNDFENLFESQTFIPPTEFRGSELRKWRDNTGAYEVQARLAIIFPDKVRLQKENGRTTTVPMRRLSSLDKDYVRWVADQMIRSGNGTPVGE